MKIGGLNKTFYNEFEIDLKFHIILHFGFYLLNFFNKI
jgi:hypothetical protein